MVYYILFYLFIDATIHYHPEGDLLSEIVDLIRLEKLQAQFTFLCTIAERHLREK